MRQGTFRYPYLAPELQAASESEPSRSFGRLAATAKPAIVNLHPPLSSPKATSRSKAAAFSGDETQLGAGQEAKAASKTARKLRAWTQVNPNVLEQLVEFMRSRFS